MSNAQPPNAIALNKVVSFHYKLAEVAPDGTRGDWLEESRGGEPLLYLHGFHNVVVGLERALEGKSVGKSIEITLKPEEAYGPRKPDAVQRVPIKHLQLQQGVTKLTPGVVASVKTTAECAAWWSQKWVSSMPTSISIIRSRDARFITKWK